MGTACIVTALSAQSDLFSSSEARGPALLKGGMGVHAAGMGDAFVGVADDVTALYWNPAGINQMPTSELVLEHREAFEGVQQGMVAFARPVWWKKDRRTWGASLSYLSGPSFDVVESGSVSGTARPWDGVLGLSYAQTLGRMNVGSTMKVVRQELYGRTAQAYALDVGLLGQVLKDRMAWGASLANVGTPLDWGAFSTKLPTVARGGLSYRFFPGTNGHRILTTFQLDVPFDGATMGHLGVEYALPVREGLGTALRAGYRTSRERSGVEALSFGAGILWRSFRFDYAFTPYNELENVHLLGIGVCFGPPLPQETRRQQLLAESRHAVEEGKLVKAQALVDEALTLSPRHGPAQVLSREIRERFSESVDPETLFILGYHAHQKNQVDVAVDFLRRLAVIQPDHLEGKALLAQVEAEQATERDARIRQSVLRAHQREITRAVSRAEEEMKQSRWSDALRSWQTVLTLESKHVQATAAIARCREALYDLGLKAQSKGDVSAAISYYRLAQQEISAYKDTPARLRTLISAEETRQKEEAQHAYTEGVRAYGEGRLGEARTLLEKALKGRPDDVMIRRALETVEEELRHTSSNPGRP